MFVVNELNGQPAAIENARRQALAAVNDLMRAYKMLDLKLNDTLLNNIMILGLQHASTRWSRTPIPKNGRSHEETKKQKLVHGLLRHGSGTVRGTDAAGHHHPHCHVHRACGGQLSHCNGVHGVRHHHGVDGLRTVSLLGLLFVPDKEIALIFTVLLGYYPLVKPRFDRIRPRALQLVCKLLLCNAAVLAMYGLLLVLVPAGSVSQELRTTALAMSLLTLGMGNVAFVLYDRALCNMLLLYKLKWQPKLHKMLGMH